MFYRSLPSHQAPNNNAKKSFGHVVPTLSGKLYAIWGGTENKREHSENLK